MLTVRSRDLSIAASISLKEVRACVLTPGPVRFAASDCIIGYVAAENVGAWTVLVNDVAFRKFGWPVGVARGYDGTVTAS